MKTIILDSKELEIIDYLLTQRANEINNNEWWLTEEQNTVKKALNKIKN